MVENAIATYVGLRRDRVFLNAAFAVMDWFADRLFVDVANLSLCGPLEVGKTTVKMVFAVRLSPGNTHFVRYARLLVSANAGSPNLPHR